MICCFRETRQLADEWTYRFLAAAHAWAITEHAARHRISPTNIDITESPCGETTGRSGCRYGCAGSARSPSNADSGRPFGFLSVADTLILPNRVDTVPVQPGSGAYIIGVVFIGQLGGRQCHAR